MEKLITISVAAYNVEKTIEQALRSLSDERYIDDIEVLVIDDGSSDGTGKIALEYQKLFPGSFKYVRKENGGHGSTINKGIELATGKYFRVLDGDDWVDEDAFAEFILKLRTTDADMVLTDYTNVYGDKKRVDSNLCNVTTDKIYSLDTDSEVKSITIHEIAIKTKLLKNSRIWITEKCLYVDIEFVVWSIYLSDNFVRFDTPYYMYRRNVGSQSTAKKNMLKNIGMQETVAYKLASLYEQFKSSRELTQNKEAKILTRILRSMEAVLHTYLLLDNSVETKNRMKSFETRIAEISPSIYERLGRKSFVRVMRFGGYSLLPACRMLYKLYLLGTGKK